MQNPQISTEDRKTTFKEVEKGFTQKQALKEANRCLQCANPLCVKGCPAGVDIPGFIKLLKADKIKRAAKLIRESDYFPSICGRICQHEKQCEAACILAHKGEQICIGGLERFVGDNAELPKKKFETNGKTAAIIGSGPSGLTTAAMLAQEGINVTVFEVSNSFGGVIKYGVPEFRLPKAVVARELKGLHELGIDFEPNAKIAEESLNKVSKKFDVVFVGTGVGATKKLEIMGHELKGVMSAMKFLVNLNQSDMPMINPGEKVVVVGAGYVGIDAARSAIRLGARKVTCVTIAKKEDALKSVSEKDYDDAEEEGVKFLFGLQVDRFDGTEKVEKVHYTNGKKGTLNANKVLVAIGQKHDKDELKKPLRNNGDGCIEVNTNNQTKLKNVFAAGDCVHGPKTVIDAIAAGRDAANAMLDYLGIEKTKVKIKSKKGSKNKTKIK
ncbi:MAG: FAD-dependent oxidoreductase [Candidatus Diapherotrites archaeon]|nr:FAD-dependent oxidoreductase [Candidatus Diapherotrites archaeon]MBT4596455.1 FAD-dependent oxidoreductase [Candidatus Diapherotrites archaeon]